VLIVIGLAAGSPTRISKPIRAHGRARKPAIGAALEHAAPLAQWKGETLGISASGNASSILAAARRRIDMATDVDRRRPRAARPARAARHFGARIRGLPVTADAILPLRASGRNEPYVIQITSPEWFTLLAADPLNRVALTGPIAR
jgi:hypothetical protein